MPQAISAQAILNGSGALMAVMIVTAICKVDGDGESLLLAVLTMSCDECCDDEALLMVSGEGDGAGCDGEC